MHPDDCLGYRSFLKATLAVGTSGSVFAVKMHRAQLEDAVGLARVVEPKITDVELIRSWLPLPQFVFLYRRDEIRRAISHYRALQSDVWWREDDGGSSPTNADRPPVHFEAIDDLLRRGRRQLDRWRDFFRRTGVRPLNVAYEDLASDPQGTVEAILAELRVEALTPIQYTAPRLQRQADSWTDETVHSYVTWRRNRGISDDKNYGADYQDEG